MSIYRNGELVFKSSIEELSNDDKPALYNVGFYLKNIEEDDDIPRKRTLFLGTVKLSHYGQSTYLEQALQVSAEKYQNKNTLLGKELIGWAKGRKGFPCSTQQERNDCRVALTEEIFKTHKNEIFETLRTKAFVYDLKELEDKLAQVEFYEDFLEYQHYLLPSPENIEIGMATINKISEVYGNLFKRRIKYSELVKAINPQCVFWFAVDDDKKYLYYF